VAHVHAKDSNYFIEQLCTIGVCGALGGVAITMWLIPGGLGFLGEQFQKPNGQPLLSPVLWGGVAVVALVLIRAVAVWFSVGKPDQAQTHNHSNEHKHDHEHDLDHHLDHADGAHDHHNAHDHDHGHDHAHEHSHVENPAQDHGHDHGWAPWRYVILLMPVGLYSLGLVPSAFSNLGKVDTNIDEGSGAAISAKGGEVINGFLELGRASATPQARKNYEGRIARVIGQAVINADSRRFGLVRYKISCCAADAVPLNMVVEVRDDDDNGKRFNAQTLQGKWVEVKGIIQFRTLRGTDEYVTVLVVKAEDVIPQAKTPTNPFVY
jgi:hypothetical protein